MRVYSRDGESFNYDSEDELCIVTGDSYFVGDKRDISASELIDQHLVDTITDQMEENLYNMVGEVSLGSLYVTEITREGILSVLKTYVDTEIEVGCYAVENVEEKTRES